MFEDWVCCKPNHITVKVGPSQLNLETPAMGRNRLLINPRLDVKSIPNKQYLFEVFQALKTFCNFLLDK